MVIRWINEEKRRYYTAGIVQDLFNVPCVVTAWGGIGNRRGGTKSKAFLSHNDAEHALATLARRRARRGYVVTPA